jgi:hypothetical protein
MRRNATNDRGLRTRRCLLPVAAMLVLPLSGCFFVDRGELSEALALGAKDGELVLAVCEPVSFSRASIEYRVGDEPWVEFWSYQGIETSLQPGDLISPHSAAQMGMEATAAPPDGSSGTIIAVSLTGTDETVQSSFRIPEDGLAEGRWVRVDDEQYPDPCPK